MLSSVLRQLEEAGAQVLLVDTDVAIVPGRSADVVIELTIDDRHARFAIEERQRSPYPGEVERLAAQSRAGTSKALLPLLVAPFVTDGVGRRLAELGWSWADECGNFDVRAPGLRLRQRLSTKAPAPKPSTLPRGTGSWAVIRWLVTHASVPSISHLGGVGVTTMPRVYQVVQDLTRLGLVERKGYGPLRVEREQLVDRFLAEYPGPGGSETYFYTLDDPAEVAKRLASAPFPEPAVISADVGAEYCWCPGVGRHTWSFTPKRRCPSTSSTKSSTTSSA